MDNGTFYKPTPTGHQISSIPPITALRPASLLQDSIKNRLNSRMKKTISCESVSTLSKSNQSGFEEDIAKEMECSICLNLIYGCVTCMPCLHNFCGACLSAWTNTSYYCPQCRTPIANVNKNPMANNIIQKYIKKNPECERSQREKADMDARDKYLVDPTTKNLLKFENTNKYVQFLLFLAIILFSCLICKKRRNA